MRLSVLFEILSIGIPFCVFKIVAGTSLGFSLLTILGIIDLFVNVLNFFAVVFRGQRLLKSCTFAIVINYFKRRSIERANEWHDLGNAIDVFLSFLIVAYVIGSGLITSLDETSLRIWNIAVILNVLGAGYGRLQASYRKLNTKNIPN